MNLPTPKTNTQEILLTLIENGEVSILNFPYLSSFRTRVSELKRLLPLYTENKTSKNKFGNSYTFVKHCLMSSNIDLAKRLYIKISAHE